MIYCQIKIMILSARLFYDLMNVYFLQGVILRAEKPVIDFLRNYYYTIFGTKYHHQYFMIAMNDNQHLCVDIFRLHPWRYFVKIRPKREKPITYFISNNLFLHTIIIGNMSVIKNYYWEIAYLIIPEWMFNECFYGYAIYRH
jgi:hypothetical protein